MISKYKSRLDQAIGLALLFHALFCSVAAFLIAGWFVYGVFTVGLETMIDIPLLPATAAILVACTIAILWVNGQIPKGKKGSKHFGLYFAVSVIALFCSAGFYQDTMHDIALAFFDSHGRFGCLPINGGPWLTSATLPWLTFASWPLFVAVCLVVTKRTAKEEAQCQ